MKKNPFNKVFPYSKQYIDNEDIQSVIRVLKSGFLTQGPEILKTEKKIAKYVGSKYAVLTSSCSAGLHIATKALSIGKKSNVVTTPITFVSTMNAPLHCGSKVFISDINENTINLCPKSLEDNFKKKKIDLIIPVHFSGTPCDMKNIKAFAKKKKAKILEDAAHAFGSKYENGKKVGSCVYSDATVFSFHPVKTIAGGEGGAITTNSKRIYTKLLEYRSHGINKDPKERFINTKEGYTKNKKNVWFYDMKNIGYHYRQTDIHSALISSQINKIKKFLLHRKKCAKNYDKLFKDEKNIKLYNKKVRHISSNHLYVLKIFFDKIKISRNELMKRLRQNNIITQVHYIPLSYHSYLKKNKNIKIFKIPNAIKYYNTCLSIPIFYGLKNEEQLYIFNKIKKLVNE